jgi:glycosyltransferase involved in cell wall biosynthesis
MNPKLSLLIPVIPGRPDRLQAILTRVSLSMHLYNEKFPEKLESKDVEFVIVDGGSDDHTKDMCTKFGEYHAMKYIYVPIKEFINAGYPRNIGLRVCEGDVIGHLDIDHFPSEHIVEGMLRPFLEGKDKIINRGYVVDTTKSPLGKGPNIPWLNALNTHVLNPGNLRCQIMSLYEQAKIPPPGRNNTLWIWAVKRKYVEKLNGYDEQYCRMYVREDDDWRERLLALGCPFYDGHHKTFCAVHLWHPAVWRTKSNEYNKKLFFKLCAPVRQISRNHDREWGKMLEGSFSIMGGKYREPPAHEEWVHTFTSNIGWLTKPTWKNVAEFKESLDGKL